MNVAPITVYYRRVWNNGDVNVAKIGAVYVARTSICTTLPALYVTQRWIWKNGAVNVAPTAVYVAKPLIYNLSLYIIGGYEIMVLCMSQKLVLCMSHKHLFITRSLPSMSHSGGYRRPAGPSRSAITEPLTSCENHDAHGSIMALRSKRMQTRGTQTQTRTPLSLRPI